MIEGDETKSLSTEEAEDDAPGVSLTISGITAIFALATASGLILWIASLF